MWIAIIANSFFYYSDLVGWTIIYQKVDYILYE